MAYKDPLDNRHNRSMAKQVGKIRNPRKTTEEYTDNLRDKTRTQSREFDKQGTRTTIHDRKGRQKKVITKEIGGIPGHSTYVKKETTKFSKKLRKDPTEQSGKMKTKTVVTSPKNIQHDNYYGEFTGVRSKEGKKIRSKDTYDFETLETTHGKSKRKNLNPKQFSRQSKKLQK